MHGPLYALRGISSWPTTQATVSSVKVVSEGGRAGRINRLDFSYHPPASGMQSGHITVDSYSSLYPLREGDSFDLQFDPRHPQRFYCDEANTLAKAIREIALFIGIAFAVVIAIIMFAGNLQK